MSAKTILFPTTNIGKLKEFQNFFQKTDYKLLNLKELKLSFDEEAIENSDYFMTNGLIKFLQGACYLKKKSSKLKTIHALIVDDSGLCVPLLDYKPGVHSASFGGPEKDAQKNINALLLKMEKSTVPFIDFKGEKRLPAFFVTFLVFGWLKDIYHVPQSFESDAKSLVRNSLMRIEHSILKQIDNQKNKAEGFRRYKELDYFSETQNFHSTLKVFVGASYGYVSKTYQNNYGGFGYDPIFYSYNDKNKSYAELSVSEKNNISHRGLALKELRDYLTSVT